MQKEFINEVEAIIKECKDVPCCACCSWFDKDVHDCPFNYINPGEWNLQLLRKMFAEFQEDKND